MWKNPPLPKSALAEHRILKIQVSMFAYRWWLVLEDTVIKGNESRQFLEGYLAGLPAIEPKPVYEIVDSYTLTGRNSDWNYR